MVSFKSASAVALFGAALAIGCAGARAQDPLQAYRQTLYASCDQFTGHAHGICMQYAAQTMKDAGTQSRTLYQDCRAQNNSREYCDQQRDAFWLSSLNEIPQ